jgi:serine phosphatase RsbU (regulator of sigma subunit)
VKENGPRWSINNIKETKMSEEIKDVNAKIDAAEEAVKKYASKDTVISIGGYEFTPAKMMVAFTLVSSILGGLYGAFEVYKDYQSMKKRINEYVAPDLSELNKKMEITMQNSEKSVQYTQDIKNDLKQDIRRLESVVEGVERGVKQNQRETDLAVKEAQTEVRQTLKQVQGEQNSMRRDLDSAIKETNANVDKKIQRALDNPLANR